jgi:hypothetical protein
LPFDDPKSLVSVLFPAAALGQQTQGNVHGQVCRLQRKRQHPGGKKGMDLTMLRVRPATMKRSFVFLRIGWIA